MQGGAKRSSEFLAVDTETTGLSFNHGVKPFLISTCDENGETKCWEFPVDPITRQPTIPHEVKREIADYLRDRVLVFHHVKYDLKALVSIGFSLYFRKDKFSVSPVVSKGFGQVSIQCETFHDTLLTSHACSSGDEHGLKHLGVKYLRYSDMDEDALKRAVNHAAGLCKKYEFPVTLGVDPKGKRQTAFDYWLPKYVAGQMQHELETLTAERNALLAKDSYRETRRREKISKLIKEMQADIELLDGVCLEYARKDVERTILLWKFYNDSGLIDELNVRKGYERERRLAMTVFKMEAKGISVNKKLITKKTAELRKKVVQHDEKAFNWARRKSKEIENINSDQQLRKLLYEDLKLEVLNSTDKGIPSVDKDTLVQLLGKATKPISGRADKGLAAFLTNLLLSRSYTTAITYLESYNAYAIPLGSGYYAVLYPSLNQTGTGTTRFSSSNPNGQNISKIAIIKLGKEGEPWYVELPGPRLRDLFTPLPGKIWYDIDYSQLELRVFAKCSNEKALIHALDDGHDFHDYVATRLFKKPSKLITKQERTIAKNTNFAIIFGGSPWRVDLTAGMNGAYEMFAGQFPNVMPFMEKTIAQVRKDGYVRTLDGYRLDVPHNAPYKGVNYMVQGTAGDIIKNAMVEIDQQELVDWQVSRLVLQVHDELIVETSNKQAGPAQASFVHRIMDVMEDAGKKVGVNTPVSCDRITSDWGHGEAVAVTPTRITPVKEKAA